MLDSGGNINESGVDILQQRNVMLKEYLYIYGKWICPYISRHLLSLNPLLACCRRYSRGER
ncbi:TPA: hypothetical protein GF106_25250 [Escherichia coli]|nr:hypothetical protein DU328_24620 [Escherichia coli]HAH3517326.1 hypothetical protein [Escherichia coli]